MQKKRLDIMLVEKKLVQSRSLAQRMVMAGNVRVNGQLIIKPSIMIDPKADISLEHGPKYVSRGGEKLEAALDEFSLPDFNHSVCVDVGASTGGFTDCLLQHGAKRVYAVDVGYGVLHWKLRNDGRVVVMERTNARYVEGFPEKIDLVTIDASFISLRILLPVVKAWFQQSRAMEQSESSPGEQIVIALVKPQFEAGKADAAKGEGVIRDAEIHRQVLTNVLNYAADQGFFVSELIRSPLLGPKGNAEFLTKLIFKGEADKFQDREKIAALILQIIEPAVDGECNQIE